MAAKKSGRPPHKPDEKTRKMVEAMSAAGIPQDDIALVVGITSKTMREHYRQELDTAAIKANTKIAQTLFNKAVAGDTTAAIWWTKARMRWAERQEHTGDKDNPVEMVIRWQAKK